jgi:hypothetical protein
VGLCASSALYTVNRRRMAITRCARMALIDAFALQEPAHILGPMSPADIDTGVCGKLKVDLAGNGMSKRRPITLIERVPSYR